MDQCVNAKCIQTNEGSCHKFATLLHLYSLQTPTSACDKQAVALAPNELFCYLVLKVSSCIAHGVLQILECNQ